MKFNKSNMALFVAVLLMLGGAVLSATDIIEASVERRAVDFDGPRDVQGLSLRLREVRTRTGLSVDLIWGEEVIASDLSLQPDGRAAADNYADRYANQLWLYAPDPVSLPWHLVVADRSLAQPRYSRYVLNRAAPLETQRVTGDLASMRADYNLEVLRRPESDALHLLLPPPTLIFLGALIFVLRPVPGLGAAPTLALVLGIVALASFVAWPVMLHVGPSRSLLPALLALCITLLVALGLGPRWQTALARRARVLRMALGIAVAMGLLGVFTLVWVQINGFMAPVFRPPGAGLSPGEWFVQDMVAPSLAVGGLGLIPAVLAGMIYGASLRERGDK